MSRRVIPCPGCTTEMDVRTKGTAEIDVCPGCAGVWLDADEISTATGRPFPPPVPKQYSGHACPVCRDTLRVSALGRVTVDWCPRCLGMYLDRGELEVIRGMRVHRPPEPQDAESGGPVVAEIGGTALAEFLDAFLVG